MGNTTYVPGGSAQLGEWLKLTRVGNTLTAYKSTEPGGFVPPTHHFELIGYADHRYAFFDLHRHAGDEPC